MPLAMEATRFRTGATEIQSETMGAFFSWATYVCAAARVRPVALLVREWLVRHLPHEQPCGFVVNLGFQDASVVVEGLEGCFPC